MDIPGVFLQSLVMEATMKAYPKTLNRARIIRLYKSGKNVAEIARQVGYPTGHGNNRVRGLLMKAGVFKLAK
jgi:hypothetical protein